MDAGKSLRVFMTERNVSAKQLGNDLNISPSTVATLRKSKLISGKNLQMLCNYFYASPSEFLKAGEEVIPS